MSLSPAVAIQGCQHFRDIGTFLRKVQEDCANQQENSLIPSGLFASRCPVANKYSDFMRIRENPSFLSGISKNHLLVQSVLAKTWLLD
tara:strand:+ start:69 stop:332 length:264 start_codon:yes stop_codon:yes gene_type:complete